MREKPLLVLSVENEALLGKTGAMVSKQCFSKAQRLLLICPEKVPLDLGKTLHTKITSAEEMVDRCENGFYVCTSESPRVQFEVALQFSLNSSNDPNFHVVIIDESGSFVDVDVQSLQEEDGGRWALIGAARNLPDVKKNTLNISFGNGLLPSSSL